MPAAEWNRWVDSRAAAVAGGRVFLAVFALCGALVGAAFVPAYGVAAVVPGAALGALLGAATDRVRPRAIRRALGTSAREVEVVLGADAVLMNGRRTRWLPHRIDPASVALAPGDPCVLRATANVVASNGHTLPVEHEFPVPRDRAEAAARALRALGRG